MSNRVLLPRSMDDFRDRSDEFARALDAAGAEILAPMADCEVLRVNSIRGPAVLYRTPSDDLFWPPEMRRLWLEFQSRTLPALARKFRRRSSRDVTLARVMTIAERDGWECFFGCGTVLDRTTATVEHLVCRAHGGPDHVSNMFIACAECNRGAGRMAAAEKIALRERNRREQCTG